MKRGKAIRQLNSIRKEAEDHLLLDARDGDAADSIWARDIEALTAGIQALSAQGPDRTGRLQRDSKMLEQVLAAVAAIAYEGERPMLDAIMAYWRQGKQAESPIEIAALNEYRKECLWHVRPDRIDSRKEIISKVALLLLADVYPQTAGEEATTND